MHALRNLPKKERGKRQPVRWHFGASDLVSLFGVVCKCIVNDAKGYVFAPLNDLETSYRFTREEFELFRDGPDYDYEAGGLDPLRQAAKLRSGYDAFADLPEHKKALARQRLVYVKKYIATKKLGRVSAYWKSLDDWLKKEQAAIDAEAHKAKRAGQFAATFTLVKRKRFLEWVKAYLKDGPLGLVDHYDNCGNRDPRFEDEEYDLLDKYVDRFLSRERPTVVLLFEDMEDECTKLNVERRKAGLVDLRCPSYETLRAEIADLPPFLVMAARKGEDVAKRFFHPSSGGVRNLDRPLQRVEADDWETHLHTLLRQTPLLQYVNDDLKEKARTTRCVLTAAICCSTRVIPAITLALGPSTANTKELLRMSLVDKTAFARSMGCETPWEYHGTIGTFAVDEGNVLNNPEIHTICDDLGIAFASPQIDTPQQRSKVERFFQTLEIRSLLRFSGRTFGNVVVRGKYEAALRACVTVEELAAIVIRFVVDVYHNTEHAGIDGMTPRQCWLMCTKNERAPFAPPGQARIRRGFGETFQATLHPEGIEIFGVWYGHKSPVVADRFQNFPQQIYDIKVDSEDLGAISLRVDNGWHTLAGPSELRGVCIAVWDEALGDLRRQNQNLQRLLAPVVQRAIDFARGMDIESRKRLGILYRPKTREELEAIRIRMNQTMRIIRTDDVPSIGPTPAGPIDILKNRIPVGTKALPDSASPPPGSEQPAPATAEKVEEATRKTTRTASAKPKPTKPPADDAVQTRASKPARPWKPKERK
ncbi:putative transposase [Bradyrhizobium sp. LB12.1]|uniref:integrase n=1 Tax=Bradyrhizobium sp. LB12.1 TaxID=3156327 RepID=UPI0033987E15